MITYWDLRELDRANLTKDELDRYKAIELMGKGLIVPDPPEPIDVTDPAGLPKRTWFSIAYKDTDYYASRDRFALVFATAEDAQAVLAMNPRVHKTSYDIGDKFPWAQSPVDIAIEPVELFEENELNRVRATLAENKAKRDKRQKEMRAFQEAAGKAEKAIAALKEDYYDCRAMKAKCGEVRDRLSEYEELSGDREVAVKFLLKAYDREDIERANEWLSLGIDLPPDENETEANA